ncbi:MAG TPA: SDR family oxidoreductase [Candidatus Wallbacteria bacterium]|nr:SDR family oxidoreductase [Candidatus Wallbacteria bacterium]
MSKKILVIGATGRTGGELVKLLVQDGQSVRVATRNPPAALSKFKNAVEAVEFDYERPSTFVAAVDGVDKIFLSVRPGDNHSDKFAMPLVDEAKKANVRHIVALTAMGVEKDDAFMLRILEKYIESSGISYTHLRPNWFMQNFDSGPMFQDIKATGALHLPAADAKISFIDLRDIAAVGFAALTGSGHINKAYTLTGRESLSYFEVVEKLSGASGKRISYVPISEAEARAGLMKAAVPGELIERWADFHRKIRQGHCSPVTADVELVIGRAPITFDQYVKDYAAAWK